MRIARYHRVNGSKIISNYNGAKKLIDPTIGLWKYARNIRIMIMELLEFRTYPRVVHMRNLHCRAPFFLSPDDCIICIIRKKGFHLKILFQICEMFRLRRSSRYHRGSIESVLFCANRNRKSTVEIVFVKC